MDQLLAMRLMTQIVYKHVRCISVYDNTNKNEEKIFTAATAPTHHMHDAVLGRSASRRPNLRKLSPVIYLFSWHSRHVLWSNVPSLSFRSCGCCATPATLIASRCLCDKKCCLFPILRPRGWGFGQAATQNKSKLLSSLQTPGRIVSAEAELAFRKFVTWIWSYLLASHCSYKWDWQSKTKSQSFKPVWEMVGQDDKMNVRVLLTWVRQPWRRTTDRCQGYRDEIQTNQNYMYVEVTEK